MPASARILFLATPRRSPLRLRLDGKHAAWHKRAISPKSDDRFGFNPNRSSDTPGSFPMGKMRLPGILPASVRILFPATPRRSPLRLRLDEKHAAWHKRAISPKSDDRFGFNPNRSLDTPCPFLIGKMRLPGILPASARILFPATPRRSPLRLRLGGKHAAWHKRAISPKSDDRFGLKSNAKVMKLPDC